jgi:hypothetical protein
VCEGERPFRGEVSPELPFHACNKEPLRMGHLIRVRRALTLGEHIAVEVAPQNIGKTLRFAHEAP